MNHAKYNCRFKGFPDGGKNGGRVTRTDGEVSPTVRPYPCWTGQSHLAVRPKFPRSFSGYALSPPLREGEDRRQVRRRRIRSPACQRGRATVLNWKTEKSLGTRICCGTRRAHPCASRAWFPAGTWPKRLFGLGNSGQLAHALPRSSRSLVFRAWLPLRSWCAPRGRKSKLQGWPSEAEAG